MLLIEWPQYYVAPAPGERLVARFVRSAHYRWPGWIAICERHGIVRNISRKGRSGDNARTEGFFGALKSGFF